MKHRRNTSGQAYALTALTPIVPGHESELTGHLDSLGGGDASPLARVPGTHFARWVVIDDVVFQGGSQRRDRLKTGRLLFTSNFDGSLDAYLEAMRTGLAEDADAIWSHCVGYPGRDDAARFAGWFRAHQIESTLFFAAYGAQTVDEVRGSLALRTRLIDFALASQGLPADQLLARFRKEFGV